VSELLRSFAAADASDWPGLPAGLALADVGEVLALSEVTGNGALGDARRPAAWVAAASRVYRGGLRVWHEHGAVVLLEGRDPFDEAGQPLVAPEAGEPEALLETSLGRLRLADGERVYASRGLALRVNPANGVLLGVLAFVPTTADDYRERLRPALPPKRLLRELASHGKAA
jgi:hypothetical protein